MNDTLTSTKESFVTQKFNKKGHLQQKSHSSHIMPKRKKPQRGRRRKALRGKKRIQRGGGPVSVVAGLPKAAWSITKAIGRSRAKQEEEHTKRMLERMRRGEKVKSGGESFRCPIM